MTVLGVVIGTTSVVVMVSLGIGMSQSYLDSIAANTSLREAPDSSHFRGKPPSPKLRLADITAPAR